VDDPIYIIDQATCTDCGACDDVCPVDAIEWEKTAD
jgi:NAD-dependent dihydropyrimidine dehydrogenase PreA subunit